MHRVFAALIAVLVLCANAAESRQETAFGSGAVLRVLDKVTGQSRDLAIAAGATQTVGPLTVELRECRYPTGNRAGDAFAGMEIRERGQVRPIFDGWMIASAPALSALDHAQFDVWVIRCAATP